MSYKETVYGAFVDYYGDITLQVINKEGDWAVLCTRVNSGLNINRYIFVIVPARRLLPSQTHFTLNTLDWVSFQTRSTYDNHNVDAINLALTPERKEMLSDLISVSNREKDKTHYVTDSLPIKITLVHDPKKNNTLQYPDKARLYQALETYNCVIELL